MAKQVTAQIRLQVPGGTATPAPPVGPALGQHGVNIGQFVSQFNDRTKEMRGITIPVVITVYSDRTFEFVTKSPPAAVLLKQAAGIPLEKKKGGDVINEEEKKEAERQVQGLQGQLRPGARDRPEEAGRPQRPRRRPRDPHHRRHRPQPRPRGRGLSHATRAGRPVTPPPGFFAARTLPAPGVSS